MATWSDDWWNDVEDGRPAALPMIQELHKGTAAEVLRYSWPVRLPRAARLLDVRRRRFVLRAAPPYTDKQPITVALEALRTE